MKYILSVLNIDFLLKEDSMKNWRMLFLRSIRDLLIILTIIYYFESATKDTILVQYIFLFEIFINLIFLIFISLDTKKYFNSKISLLND